MSKISNSSRASKCSIRLLDRKISQANGILPLYHEKDQKSTKELQENLLPDQDIKSNLD